MSRRQRAKKRKINPDYLYNSVLVARFINRVMVDGKKSLATKIVYNAMENFAKKIGEKDVLEAFEKALDNTKPAIEVKSKRIGGSTYQVPVEVRKERQEQLAMSWIIDSARKKKGKNMVDSLTIELTDCFNNQGGSIQKKENTHKMAKANEAFAHHGW